MFRTELRETGILVPEEVLICGLKMQLHIRKCQRIDLFQPGEFGLVLCGRIPQHLSCLIVMIDLIGQHTIIDEPAAAEGLRKLLFLKPAGIDPEPKSFEITVHLFFSP